MPTFSIYKYDKSNESYLRDWTAVSDIGSSFHGKKLTLDQYLEAENHYVQVVQKLLNALQISTLTVQYLSKGYSLRYEQKHGFLDEQLSIFYQKLDHGQELNQQEILDVIRLNLRECIGCVLYHPKIQIYMGYDYYMYVKLDQTLPLETISKIIRSENLFWDIAEWDEYFMEEPEENHLAFGYRWSNGNENPPGNYHQDLRISKDDPLNRTYTEWSNFDEIKNGLDWEEYQVVEQKYIQLVLEPVFTKNVKLEV